MLKMITNTNAFEKDVLDSDLPVLVDFFAARYGPCQMLAPVLEQVVKRYEGRVKVLKVNVEESQDLAKRFGITAVPTLILFNQGKPVQKIMDIQSPGQMASLLDEVTCLLTP